MDESSADGTQLAEADGRIVDGDVPLTGIAHAVVSSILKPMNDQDLTAAYQKTDGEPGNPIADLLAFEMAHRGIDF